MGPSSRRFFRGDKGISRPAGVRLPRRWAGRKLPASLLLLGFLGTGFFFLQEWLIDLKFRPLVTQELSKALQTPVRLKSIRVNLLGQVVLKDLAFTLPGSPWEVGVEMDKAEVDLMLRDLAFRHKPLEACLESLSFDGPRILFRHKEVPRGLVGPPAPGTPPPPEPAPSALPPLPLIPRVDIRGGLLLFQAGKVPREILDDVHLTARTGKGAVWGLELQARAPEGDRRASLQFHGNFRPDEAKISGKVEMKAWPLVFSGLVLRDLAGWTMESGRVDLESPLVLKLGRGMWFDAKVLLEEASVRSPAPASIRFSHIGGRVNVRPTELTLPGGVTFRIGETGFTALGTLPLDGRPLALSAGSDDLHLSTLFSEVLKMPNVKAQGEGKAQISVKGSFQEPLVEASASLGPSSVADWPLDSFSAKASYQDGVVHLLEAKGRLYDGRFEANGFRSMSGGEDAPVSLYAAFKDIEAARLPQLPGLRGLEGKSDFEVKWGGTNAHRTFTATSRMALTRKVNGVQARINLHSSLVHKDGDWSITTLYNDKGKLEGTLKETDKGLEIRDFTYSAGKKEGRLSATGLWPKSKDLPLGIRVNADEIELQDLPFLGDLFPGVEGKVDLDAKLEGTRSDPRASLHLVSGALAICSRPPRPMEIQASWTPDEVRFERFDTGGTLSVLGRAGVAPEAPLDLDFSASKMPLDCLAAFLGMGGEFQGALTGTFHLSGTRREPSLSSKEPLVLEGFQAGGIRSEKVEALLALDRGKWLLRKLHFQQGAGSLDATGTWDTRSQPGSLQLSLLPKDFPLGAGPLLSGRFLWSGETKGGPLKGWSGNLSSTGFELRTAEGAVYSFPDLSLPVTADGEGFQGRIRLGRTLAGTAGLVLSKGPLRVWTKLQIAPVPLKDSPEISQFLPPGLKASGTLSGNLTLKEGTLEDLPLSGRFRVSQGSLGDYKFDRQDLEFDGNRKKIGFTLSLHQEKADYSMSGSLESPKAFWDPGAQMVIHGPVSRLGLAQILSLVGMDTRTHRLGGAVDGDIALTGTLSNPSIGFLVKGEDLQFDDLLAPKAQLKFTFDKASGKVLLGKSSLQLPKGKVEIKSGKVAFDTADPSRANVEVIGSAQDVPLALFNLTSFFKLSGDWSLSGKGDRPDFGGSLSLSDEDPEGTKASPFRVDMTLKDKVVTFERPDTQGPKLMGSVDFSKDQRVDFHGFHLEDSPGSFSVDGTLDLAGESKLVSDAKDIPIEAVGRWLVKDFPLKGKGGYHLIFEGSMEEPILTASLSVSNGRVGKLDFDLLSGFLKTQGGTLYLGTEEAPFTLSRKGLFAFTLSGHTPLAFTKTGWLKVKDQEMDLQADMPQGDFGIILLAGLAEEASGPMDFSAHLKGTLDNPILTMDIGLKGCRLVPSSFARSVEDINGRIKVRDNHLALQDLNGRVGQGRVFISSPPAEESKMVLHNFLPDNLDLRIRTVGDRGLFLNIKGIQQKSQWGEIVLYGATPQDPLLITGPLSGVTVIGTALLQSGHFTFPPKEENGKVVTYNALGRVTFDLTLISGSDTWYTNDFAGQYLDLKVDPGDQIRIVGRDADKTPDVPGIKCTGDAASHSGFLRYLGSEFKLESASLFIPKGKLPTMQGRGKQHLRDVEVATAGSIRRMDVDIWVDFKGTFGNINFTMDSSPRLSSDPETQQKLLLSYIMFGRDMTGLSREALASAYQQRTGEVMNDALWDTVARYSSSEATNLLRPLAQQLGNLDVSAKVDPGRITGFGGQQVATDASGNTLPGQSVPLAELNLRKYLDSKFSVGIDLGLNKDLSTDRTGLGGQLGLGYDINKNLKLDLSVGRRDDNQSEGRVGAQFSLPLPNTMSAKKGDVDPPKFERFDIYSISPGKYQVVWQMDEPVSSRIEVTDPDGRTVKAVELKATQDYRHELILDGLDRETDYNVRITAKDLNGNPNVQTRRASPGG